jgi:diguanylate cyclase (GGDEF)-like protein
MSQDQVVLAILGVLIVANVLLVASILIRSFRRRRSARQGRVQPGSPAGQPERDSRAAEDARTAAAIEAFVTGVSADTAGRAQPVPPPDVLARRREAAMGTAPDATVIQLRQTDRPADDESPSAQPRPARPVLAPEWTPAELADPAMWSRTVREESARVARFGHPVTVVMAELPRLDGLADRFGHGVADRIATEAARVLVSEGRAADRIARLGDAQFGILLLETEENAASGYIERVRAAIDAWLESAGLSIRLSLGWASPGPGGDVVAAAMTAEQRMHDAERRSTPERNPEVSGFRNA